MAYSLEENFEEYFVVNDETGEEVGFFGSDFDAAVARLDELNAGS